MRGEHKFWGILLIAGLAISLSFAAGNASQAAQSNSQEPVPAFHPHPPAGNPPPTMNPALFENVLVRNAYIVAGRVKKVLYQQPCYCHCDRSQGHTSLLDCFTNRHASECNLCMDEAFYAYEQTRKGKTPAQIRAGIEKGEWEHVDTSKYQKPLR